MKPMLRLTASFVSLSLIFAGGGCKREAPPAKGNADTGAAPASAPAVSGKGGEGADAGALLSQAGKLGMISRLPKNTEFYLGTADLKPHREALQKTEFWKSLQAFIQDKRPASAKDEPLAEVREMEVDGGFVALAAGSAPVLEWLVRLNRVYTEYTYRTMITGFTGGGAVDPKNLLANAGSSPELLERLCALLEEGSLPPILFGQKTDEPQAWLDKVQATPQVQQFLQKLTKREQQVGGGSTFTVYEGTVSLWLTDKVREQWMTQLKIAVQDPALLERVQKTLEQVAAKKVAIAAGVVNGYAVFAVGSTVEHLKFADSPEESLLARQEFGFTTPYASKDVVALLHADAALLTAAHDVEPFSPMLRGALNGLAGMPIFSAVTEQIRPKADAVTAAEKDFTRQEFATATGVVWWEKGLRVEMAGGLTPAGKILDKPLKLAALTETPGAVFTWDGHSPTATVGRAFFERGMELLYTTTGAFIQAGMGGDQALGIYALADKGVIPPLVRMYEASKSLYQKSLGTETVFVMDLQGEAPMLPGVSAPRTPGAPPPSTWLPRFALVHDVTDRALLSQSWTQMEASLNEALKTLPMPLLPLQPISTEKNGITTWFYPLPLGGNDLLPCASVNDEVLMVGSSKNLNEELAGHLQKPGPALTGTHFRFSAAALRTFLKNVQGASLPGVNTAQASTALPWLEPAEDLRGRIWQDGSTLRHSITWDMHDLKKFD